MPSARDGVTEGVNSPLWIERRSVGSCEYYAGGADRCAHSARTNDSYPNRTGGLVARSRYHGRSCSQASRFSSARRNPATDFRGLPQRGKQLSVDSTPAQDFGRPLALGYVEEKRSRSICHISRTLASELEAHVIFRQHDVSNALPVSWFVFSHPKQLGEREIGERRIAGELDEMFRTEEIGKSFDLGLGALITPDESGPNYFIASIKQDCAMHLPRESDAGDFISAASEGIESTSNGYSTRLPPILRKLFCPSRLRRCEGRVLLGARGDDSPLFINDESSGSAGADIDPHELKTFSQVWQLFSDLS
jgi:hypothetical protein